MKATLRVTPQEDRALSTTFGSSGKGLRALLDRWVAGRRPGAGFPDPAEHNGIVAAAYDPPPHHGAHPDLTDFGVEDDIDLTAALALDKVTQSLPPVVDYPADTVAQRLAADPLGPDDIARVMDVPVEVLSADPRPMEGTATAAMTGDAAPASGPVAVLDTRHRHKRGPVLSTYWDGGAKLHTYACTFEGCTTVLS